jgi:hypothetical protein
MGDPACLVALYNTAVVENLDYIVVIYTQMIWQLELLWLKSDIIPKLRST